ncbi:MAG: LysR family transcriptional regulator [Burkholderiaceae bacterium]|nr:LysR family transcriptional regulator [Burkholderiaceae bacterium]
MTHRKSRIDLNLFRVLDAIYTNDGISGAAKALHLTQPAISHSLAHLREIFKDPLFIRQGNHFVPTEKARAIMPKIQQSLSGLNSTVLTDEGLNYSDMEITFTLGFRDALESIVFPDLMKQLLREAPKVTIISRHILRNEMAKELVSGSVDLVVDRRLHMDAMVCSEYLCDEPLVVVMAIGHPLASQSLQREQYLRAQHIAVTRKGTQESIDTLLHEDGHSRRLGLVCQNYFSACKAAAASEMLLTMPGRYAEDLAPCLPITLRPLPFRIKPIRLEMYWHANKDKAGAHRWLRQKVAEILRRP